MGGPGSGRQRDPARDARMAELRRQGLALAAIGRRFGLTRQAVKVVLDRLGVPAAPRPHRDRAAAAAAALARRRLARALRPPQPSLCRACGATIRERRARGVPRPVALCLTCLARRPGAPFAERLRSHRTAAGLTCNQLARKVGVTRPLITHYETGRRVPKGEVLRRLVEVLGRGLVGGKGKGKRSKGR